MKGLFIALAVMCALAIVEVIRDSRRWKAWSNSLRKEMATSWDLAPDAPCTLLSHVAADGEVIDYPVAKEWPLVDLAETLGEISSLPEAVEA